MLLGAGQKGVSDFLGAASITCWLFAQFPQVVENYRLGSCKGLALPFLINWLLGDFTNLIGCIFTDQLVFQTYLATYFTFIDAVLILQFWYYGRKDRHRLRHAHHHHHHHHQPSRQGSQYVYQSASRSRPSHSRTRSARSGFTYSQPGSVAASIIRADGSRTPDSRVTTALSPHPFEDSQTMVRFQETHTGLPAEAASPTGRPSPSRSQSNSDSEDAPPEMTQSVLSKRSDASSSTIGVLARGRSIFRPTSASAPDVRAAGSEHGHGVNWRQTSGSRTRGITAPRDRPSQSRTRSVVFLSLWAFMGLGGLFRHSSSLLPRDTSTLANGTAWKAVNAREELVATSLAYAAAATTLDDGLSPAPIDYSLLTGRVAAWMCVCFYLTSRMPQIWKNFRRRSVEGLSILLFAAAFMGNLFYVLSILSSPLVEEDETYLFESVPFLLGSGGTLIFDLTIMAQACMYAGLSPQTREKGLEYLDEEEGSGLLTHASHNDPREVWPHQPGDFEDHQYATRT